MQTAQKDAQAASPPDGWLTLPAAMRALATTRYTVLALIADGVLQQQVVGGVRFVSRESVDARIAAQATTPNE